MGIYVGNLSAGVTEEQICKVFKTYGLVKQVQIPADPETGCSRGFAFVNMADKAEERHAIRVLNGSELMGQILTVRRSHVTLPL